MPSKAKAVLHAVNSKRRQQPQQPSLPVPTPPATPVQQLLVTSVVTEPPHPQAPNVSADSDAAALADEAVSRFLEITADAARLETAEAQYRRASVTRALAQWRLNCANDSQWNASTDRASGAIDRLRRRAAVRRWREYSPVIDLRGQQFYDRVSSFHPHYLRRLCFRAWVSYTLSRADKAANARMADQLHRAAVKQAAWAHWKAATVWSKQHSALVARATSHYNDVLVRAGWSALLSEWHQWRVNGDSVDQARQHGDRTALRYYCQRWHKASRGAEAQRDEIGSAIVSMSDDHCRRAALAVWQAERRWMGRAARALHQLEMTLRDFHIRHSVERWRSTALGNEDRAAKSSEAEKHRHQTLQRQSFHQWRTVALDSKSGQHYERLCRIQCRAAVGHWLRLVRQRHQLVLADDRYARTLVDAAWACMRDAQQYHHHLANIQQLAANYHRTAIRLSVVRHWHRHSNHQKILRVNHSRAVDYDQSRRLERAIQTLRRNVHQQQNDRGLEQRARRFRQHCTVMRLQSHALQCRHHWQHTLQSRRHRYRSLLSSALAAWRQSLVTLRVAEDAHYYPRARPLHDSLRRQLFGLWLEVWRERLGEREDDARSVTLWHQRLITDAFAVWKTTWESRALTRALADTALLWWHDHSRLRLVRQWRHRVRHRQQQRYLEARESEATRVELQQIRTRRIFCWWHERGRERCRDIQHIRAAEHHFRTRSLARGVGVWLQFTELRKTFARASMAASEHFNAVLLRVSYQRWCVLFALRRHLLQRHLRARDHRQGVLVRRCWAAWLAFHAENQHQREREQRMRALRVQHLRVHGCRQWIAMATQIIAQRAEEQRRRMGEAAKTRDAAVKLWTRRIATHWRNLVASRRQGADPEARAALVPLISLQQLERWHRQQRDADVAAQRARLQRAASVAVSAPQPASSVTLSFLPAPSVRAPPRALDLSDLAPVDTSARNSNSAITLARRTRTEPRRREEFLEEFKAFEPSHSSSHNDRAVKPLAALSKPITLTSAAPLPLAPSVLLPHPVAAASPPEQPADSTLLAAVSSLERRLTELAQRRQRYKQHKIEAKRIKEQLANCSEQPNTTERSARLAELLHQCREYATFEAELKREVREWTEFTEQASNGAQANDNRM